MPEDETGRRGDFLLKVYDTYNQEIARHFGLAWQAVSIFAASLVAIATSVYKPELLPAYVVITLYLVLVTWAIEVVLDASYWYNRNLVVIANIERQFLRESDARDIQWYFKSHRGTNKPITFMRSLLLFLVVTAMIVVAFSYLYPLTHPDYGFYKSLINYVPIVAGLFCIVVLRRFSDEKNRQYHEFKLNAPGIDRGALDFVSVEHGPAPRDAASWLGKFTTGVEDWLLSVVGIEGNASMYGSAKSK